MDRYPVDTITEKTNCELHQKMKNISMKVATGFALPCGPGALWHGTEIPAGYAHVGVDEIQEGYEELDLDYPTPEGERTLREVGGGIILWLKKDIHFPGLVINAPPTSPHPHDDGDDDHNSASSSRSPPMRQPSPLPRQPSPTPPPHPPMTKSKGKNPRKRHNASLSTSQTTHKTTRVPEVSLKPLKM